MGYSVGSNAAGRDIGYGVPAICDQPCCYAEIHRGMAYLCGGCGLFFCEDDLYITPLCDDPQMCERCCSDEPPFPPKPDLDEWTNHKMTHPSWARWREENGL